MGVAIFAVEKFTDMATLISQPSSLCFSSVVEDIVFGTKAGSGVLVLDVVAGGNRLNVLTETMYPGTDGSVTVSDLGSLVEPYARQHLQVTVECSFTDTAGKAAVSPVTILFAMADVGTSASEFTQNHFLTILNGEKITARGREERLYAYGANKVTVTADMKMDAGYFLTKSTEVNASGTTGNVSQFDVSPLRVEEVVGLTGGTLLGYTVEAGSRRQDFRCVTDQVLPAPSLIFTNSFGCQEFIHCVGTHKKSSKYERNTARILGRLRNYRITEERQFTANTGWLNEAMADWADDLFRSEEVYLWVDGMVGRAVVVSDSKSEITNEDDNMPAFEFTYTYAQRIHNVMQPDHAGRIFDNTFDHTFN